MKKLIVLLSFSVAFMAQSFGQGTPAANLVALPNAENTYIQTHEITIADWNLYLNDIASKTQENPSFYQEILPNADICKIAYKTDNYLTNPDLQNYPMVGITYIQARAYCSWRTDFENANKKKSNTSMYVYSLPTEVDYQYAYDTQKTKTSVNLISGVNAKSKEVTGIADNANEMTDNRKIVTGAGTNGLRFDNYTEAGAMIGFRCKVVVK